MPRVFILILFITAFLRYGYSQNWMQDVDSLERLVARESADTGKIDLYIKLHFELIANQPERALQYSMAAMELAESIGDTARLVNAMLRQCDFFNQIGDYTSSFEIAYKALELAGNDYDILQNTHNRIASAHAGLDNPYETLYHNRKALYYSSLTGDSSEIVGNLHNIGVTHSTLENYDSALYYLRFTNDYSIRRNNRPDPYSLSNIGIVYSALEKYDSALIFHLEAYRYDSLDYQEFLLGIDEQYLADTYMKLKKYRLAKKFAWKSIQRAYKLDAPDLALENYRYLYEIYAQEGNYRQAFEHALNYAETADSLNEKESQSIILGLETKYKFQEQEEKLQLAERQRSTLITLAIVSILFVISMVVIVFLVYRRHIANKELMKQLRLANASKERMLSIISHDLRGSLGTLRTAARAISEGMTDMEDARSLLESFYPVADSTYDLLENLLTWAKYSKEHISPEFSEVRISEVVEKCIAHTNHLAQTKGVTINSSLEENLKVNADKNMLLAIVRNLLSNAIKFSYPKSEIIIDAKRVGNSVITSVSDSGVGIESESLDKLFNTPEEVQASGTSGERGSGLGISICKTFLESHGGMIWAESEPGHGSTFYFSLPADGLAKNK